jgi:hypothetical protein
LHFLKTFAPLSASPPAKAGAASANDAIVIALKTPVIYASSFRRIDK